ASSKFAPESKSNNCTTRDSRCGLSRLVSGYMKCGSASLSVEFGRCCMCGCETASERMTKSALWAPAPKQKVTFVEREGPGWTVSLDSEGDADCPICG